MLGIVYWQDEIHKGVMPHHSDTAIKVATSAGAILGQCVFGYLADLLGRKRMYGVELMIIIVATLAQSLAGTSSAAPIVGVLIFYRVVMGIGVGGTCSCLVMLPMAIFPNIAPLPVILQSKLIASQAITHYPQS